MEIIYNPKEIKKYEEQVRKAKFKKLHDSIDSVSHPLNNWDVILEVRKRKLKIN